MKVKYKDTSQLFFSDDISRTSYRSEDHFSKRNADGELVSAAVRIYLFLANVLWPVVIMKRTKGSTKAPHKGQALRKSELSVSNAKLNRGYPEGELLSST